MGRYCKPLEVYLHRNSSDLSFVIVELARLSKHSEWLINPLRFLAQKNIRPMITPLTMQLYYVELRVLLVLYRILHVDLARSRSRSSTVYGTVLGVPYVVTPVFVAPVFVVRSPQHRRHCGREFSLHDLNAHLSFSLCRTEQVSPRINNS